MRFWLRHNTPNPFWACYEWAIYTREFLDSFSFVSKNWEVGTQLGFGHTWVSLRNRSIGKTFFLDPMLDALFWMW